MTQQIKISIAKNEKSKGVLITLPTTQKEFNMLTKNEGLQAKSFVIPKVICNSYSLAQAIMNSPCNSKTLSKLNYLGEMFSHFDKDQRVLFGFMSDIDSLYYTSLDGFINLAINIKNNTEYSNYTILIPPELKLRIKSSKSANVKSKTE